MTRRVSNFRTEYKWGELLESAMSPDPFVQFETWLQAAVDAAVDEPNAMALATATASGVPSVRMVLLKEYGEEGFYFFTSYESRKAKEIEANPRAAVVFRWGALERQVRIEGMVEVAERERSDAYFSSRPKGAQLAASVSKQSAVLPSREDLEDRFRKAEKARPPARWRGRKLGAATKSFPSVSNFGRVGRTDFTIASSI
jgi:pyridoxamine-phosphate oxidase